VATAKDTTPNFKFILPRFNQQTWQDDFYKNMRAIDAIITRFFNIANYVGVWQNSTQYSVGERVLDTSTVQIFEVLVGHTTDPEPTTFSEFRQNNPTFYKVFTQEVQFRGEWQSNTEYAAGDFVTYTAASQSEDEFSVAATSHTSTNSYTTDRDNGLWNVLLRATDLSDPSVKLDADRVDYTPQGSSSSIELDQVLDAQRFDTYADMRAVSVADAKTLQVLQCRGRSTVTDGRGGTFVVVENIDKDLTTELADDEDTPGEGDGFTYVALTDDKDGSEVVLVRRTTDSIAYKPGFTGAKPLNLREELDRRVVTLEAFGGGTSKTAAENTAAFKDAIAALQNESAHIQLGLGTYEVEDNGDGSPAKAISLLDGTRIFGSGRSRTTVKLADNQDAHVFDGTSVNDITISDMTVDGNKANQTAGAGVRCIYMHTDCDRLRFENLDIINSEDHGIHLSNGNDITNRCGEDSWIVNCRFLDNGTGVGPGGSGLAGGVYSTTIIGCFAANNARRGFKSSGGVYINCVCGTIDGTMADDGFETGFDNDNLQDDATFINCRVYNSNSDGFRNQSAGHRLKFYGCVAENCAKSGLTILNNVIGAVIDGCSFRNNGQDGNRTTTDGLDGISIINTSETPESIRITNCSLYDDQGTKTQEYGVYIDDDGSNIVIGDGNEFGDHKVGPLFTEFIEGVSVSSNVLGLPTSQIDVNEDTLTGSTGTQTIKSVTLPGKSMHKGAVTKIRAHGVFRGTANTKTVRLSVGSGSTIISSDTSELSWFLDATLYHVDSTNQYIIGVVHDDSTTDSFVLDVNESTSNDLDININGELDDSSDAIDVRFLHLNTER
jgi:hypothetical protein